jgi:hypothetical protein
MRLVVIAVLAAAGTALVGCSSRPYDGPTVDAFTGRVVHDGKPVSFADTDEASLQVFLHEKGISFGIPLKSDGTFKIGWMPIGKYSVMYSRAPKGTRAGPMKYNVPAGLTIEAGKTEYTIELGKDWKP